MNRLNAFLISLRDPLRLTQVTAAVGALAAVFVLLSAVGGPPKPWEASGPVYQVGTMAAFERTFPTGPLPKASLMDGEDTVTLASFADGTPLIVNLWATWCAPCLEELPSLDALQRELGDDVRVLAVAMEPGDGEAQERMFAKLGITELTLLRDPRLQLMRELDSDLQLPLTLVYNRRGREIGRLIGTADWSAPESVRLVRAIGSGQFPG